MNKVLAALALAWLAFHFMPNTLAMSAVHHYMEYGPGKAQPDYFDTVRTIEIAATREGSCGHYSQLLAHLLAIKGEQVYVVDLVTCPTPPCGHTVVMSNSVWLDAVNNKAYYRQGFFNHSREIWTGPDGVARVLAMEWK